MRICSAWQSKRRRWVKASDAVSPSLRFDSHIAIRVDSESESPWHGGREAARPRTKGREGGVMRDSSVIESRGVVRVLLAAAAFALGAGSCMGADDFTGDQPEEQSAGAAALEVENECTAAGVTWANPA